MWGRRPASRSSTIRAVMGAAVRPRCPWPNAWVHVGAAAGPPDDRKRIRCAGTCAAPRPGNVRGAGPQAGIKIPRLRHKPSRMDPVRSGRRMREFRHSGNAHAPGHGRDHEFAGRVHNRQAWRTGCMVQHDTIAKFRRDWHLVSGLPRKRNGSDACRDNHCIRSDRLQIVRASDSCESIPRKGQCADAIWLKASARGTEACP